MKVSVKVDSDEKLMEKTSSAPVMCLKVVFLHVHHVNHNSFALFNTADTRNP